MVMHDRTWPTGFDADVAQDLLNMTVADDLADEKVKQSKRDLCNEMLGTFVGDWSSNVICVACSNSGCQRDEACKTSAVDRAVNLLMRSVDGARGITSKGFFVAILYDGHVKYLHACKPLLLSSGSEN